MSSAGPNKPVTALLLLASVLALVLGLWAARHLLHPAASLPALNAGTAMPAPRPLTPFTLTDHHGQAFTLDRLKGAWTFLFFGYTHCPDVCPTTLSTLNGIVRKIVAAPAGAAPVHVVFVTVDPERDSVARLAEYVPYFNKDFLGVTGTPAALDALTGQLNILHMRTNEPSPAGGYTLDHTASLLLIDPQARYAAVFSPPHKAAAIAQDFLTLRKYYEDNQ